MSSVSATVSGQSGYTSPSVTLFVNGASALAITATGTSQQYTVTGTQPCASVYVITRLNGASAKSSVAQNYIASGTVITLTLGTLNSTGGQFPSYSITGSA